MTPAQATWVASTAVMALSVMVSMMSRGRPYGFALHAAGVLLLVVAVAAIGRLRREARRAGEASAPSSSRAK